MWLQFNVYHANQLVLAGRAEKQLEFGRQDRAQQEPSPYAFLNERTPPRVVVARFDDVTLGRRQALVEIVSPTEVLVSNLSTAVSFQINSYDNLAAGEKRTVSTPLSLRLGALNISLELVTTPTVATIEPAQAADGFESLQHTTSLPMGITPGSSLIFTRAPFPEQAVDSLVQWMNGLSQVLYSAATSMEFFRKAAEAVRDLVGLDHGAVLLFEGNAITAPGRADARGFQVTSDWAPSQRILGLIREQKRTFWGVPGASGFGENSLMGVTAVVAAPILNAQGEVIGAIYGDRSGQAETRITVAEARLVETLANAVATGLARIEKERALLATEARYGQFFSPQLANRLASEPELLQGREAQITVLFSDIRSFSSIVHRIGPQGTVDWIQDVLSLLSECVLKHDGVLVDYVGDGLMAMWGAPSPQADHAQRACHAAIEMVQGLIPISQKWQPQLGSPIEVAIGIHSGLATVGNIGSRQKFKYGPFGGTVNLASRVQGATKHVGASPLITAATQQLLADKFTTRRLCRVRVVNIPEPVELHELCLQADDTWRTIKQYYEEALTRFDDRRFDETVAKLGNVLTLGRKDGPSLALLARTVQGMTSDHPQQYDTVWNLDRK